MMLIFLAVFLLSVGDIYGQSCHKMYETECATIEHPRKFPENKEELAEACRYAHKILSCEAKVAENCKEDEEFPFRMEHVAAAANRMVSSIEIACDPESKVYIAISDNIECISSIVPSMDLKCHIATVSEKRRNLTLTYAETVKDKEIIESSSPFSKECMSVIYEIACFSAVAGEECGEEIFQPTLQTLMELLRTEVDDVCPEDKFEEIPMFAFAFAMIEKEAQHATHELEQTMQAPFNSMIRRFKRR